MGIFQFLKPGGGNSIASIVKDISGVIRDPNQKISSKRVGAGACITVGITQLTTATDTRGLVVGCVLLFVGVVLYAMTKWDPPAADDGTAK